nr:unnamed protein product [Callosobruchus analis]
MLFEICGISFNRNNSKTIVLNCYRSPKTVNFQIFCDKLTEVLELVFEPCVDLILCGDFNVDPVRDINNYNILMNILTTLEHSKRAYYEKKINSSVNSTKCAWSVVNTLSGKNNKKNGCSFSIKHENKIINDPIVIANKFNEHFVSQPKRIFENIDTTEYYDNIHENNNTIFLTPFVKAEFLHLIQRKLKPKASSGFDGIPSFLLKKCIQEIADPLVYLVNKSFTEGNYPNLLKINKIIPLHKKGDEKLLDNHRPIALSPTLSKIFEYCYLDRFMRFLDAHHILIDNQFGFRMQRNTSDAIYAFVENIIDHIESGECPVGVFCDLSKAFDCVVHDILLTKVQKYGIRGKAYNWLTNYLVNRRQFVVIKRNENGNESLVKSETLNIEVGVPQGSILGPILFLLYINDINQGLDCDLFLFADDATATMSGKDNIITEALMQNNLDKLHNWFSRNLLLLNTTKTSYVVFHNYNNRNLNISLSLRGDPLTRSNYVKFLGVSVDENFNWKAHCEDICTKLSSLCYLMRNLRTIVSLDLLLTVYHAHISSRLSYGICFWGTSSAAKNVFLSQKRIVRCIAGVSQRTSCRELFKNFRILTLPSIAILELATIIYKNQSTLLCNSDYHRYETRGNHNLVVPLQKYRIGRQSPTYLGIKIFNKLDINIKASRNVATFRRKLKDLLTEKCYYTIEEFLI